jgi:hypothetical protein
LPQKQIAENKLESDAFAVREDDNGVGRKRLELLDQWFRRRGTPNPAQHPSSRRRILRF